MTPNSSFVASPARRPKRRDAGPLASAPLPWLRRAVFFALVTLTTGLGAIMMYDILRANGITVVEAVILPLFALTLGWIATASWTAVIGFVLRLAGLDPVTLDRTGGWRDEGWVRLRSRVAVVMPVYNEDVDIVMAGLEATWRSLRETGEGRHFDFFLLSDTRDPEIAAEEERGWSALCARLGAESRLFYRRRPENVGRKAGNLADFCRRWGRSYDFMVVLDADSVMSGETILALARSMQENPQAGLIQTVPVPSGQGSLFGRFVQFAARLHSPMLATGFSFWQLGEANYWGHNAIIRIAPFMRHCGLPALSGAPPLGGEILSHDFVEAALMRRGGWHVYLNPHLEGSHEGVPGNLLDYARRDRRWAQGNLQHLRLLRLAGLHPMSRLHFIMGALAYVSSLLWLLLLSFSTADALSQALLAHDFFRTGYQLFPDWPVSKSVEIVSLLAMTLGLLLIPKVLALILCLADSRQRARFGGWVRVTASAVAEAAFSILIAPVMMLYHAVFVVTILAGRTVSWNAQNRGGHGPALADAARYALWPTLLSIVWGTASWQYAPQFFWWLTPVLAGLALSMPLIALSSVPSIGAWLREIGLFLTPAELRPPRELREARRLEARRSWRGQVAAIPAAAVPGEVPGRMAAQNFGGARTGRRKSSRAAPARG